MQRRSWPKAGPPETRSSPAVLHLVHSLSVGGVERGLVSLLAQPALRRQRHTVCTLRAAGPLAVELPQGVKCVSLDASGRRAAMALRLAAVIRRLRPGVVHARNWGTWADAVMASALVRTCRPALVLGFHGLESEHGFSPVQRRRARWLRLSARRFTAVSHAGALQIATELHVPAPNIRVLESGVDTQRFSPADEQTRAALRRQFHVAPHERVVVMVGSLVAVKDHVTAFGAAARAARNAGTFRLWIVGDGPLRAELERQARCIRPRVRVCFLGTRADVPDLLRAADVFVLSSRYEQASNALIEAMATGLAVVATDVGDSGRLIEQGRSGLLVPPGDPPALADAIASLLLDAESRRALGTAARARMLDRYQLTEMCERYARYYESLTRAEEDARTPISLEPATEGRHGSPAAEAIAL